MTLPIDVMAIANSLLVAIVTSVAGYTVRVLKGMSSEWEVMREAQRNQLKASMVRSYEDALNKGYITHMELDTMNRRKESYEKLGGNSYIHTIVDKANHDLDIRGEIPE